MVKRNAKTYPDLKLTLPFCTQEYMSNGQSYYRNFPANIQIVMTGGRVWEKLQITSQQLLQIMQGVALICGSTGHVQITLKTLNYGWLYNIFTPWCRSK